MKLDFSSLEQAVAQLQMSFGYLHSDMAQDENLRKQFRAATIKAFEFSYELAVKMVRRQLSVIVANPDQLNGMDFKDLMREAADAGLIHDPVAYMGYRTLRNKTSHTYSEQQAEKTVAAVDEFLDGMRFLMEQLARRNP